MSDMSSMPTASRTTRCSAAWSANDVVAAPAGPDRRRWTPGSREPLRVLPARRDREVRPGGRQPVVDDRAADVAGGARMPVRPGGVAEERARAARPSDRPGSGGSSRRPGSGPRSSRCTSTGGTPSTIHWAIRLPTPPLSRMPSEFMPGRDEEPAQLGRLAELRHDVRGEALRAAEHRPDAGVVERREAIHGPRQVRARPGPSPAAGWRTRRRPGSGRATTAPRPARTARRGCRRPPRGSSRSDRGPRRPAGRDAPSRTVSVIR